MPDSVFCCCIFPEIVAVTCLSLLISHDSHYKFCKIFTLLLAWMQNKECVNAQTNYIKRYLFQLRICYTVTNENAYPVHYGLVLQHSFVCMRLKCVEFYQMNCSSDLIWYELRKFDTGLNKVIDPLHVDLGPKSFYSVF